MNQAETAKLLAIIRAGLPNAYLRLTPADAEAMTALWAALFADYDADLVTAAATAYIWNDETGKFPPPGAIRKWIVDIEAVTKQCSYGYTLREYVGAAGEKYPPGVRDYIESRAKAAYEKNTGLPWTTQAEKLRKYHAMMLAERSGTTGEAQRRPDTEPMREMFTQRDKLLR